VGITLRGDSGFCREELMGWCERNRVDYVLGLAKNDRLKAEIMEEQEQAAEKLRQTGLAARVFKEFPYQTREFVAGAADHCQSRASGERLPISVL
jgi:Transposase DDE domain group 1